MNFRERVLGIFERRVVDNIVFQPRIEHWYNVNKLNNTLPERYADMSLMQIYDDLGCSVRGYDITYYNNCLNAVEDPSVKIESEKRDGVVYTRWTTPVGTLESHIREVPAWHAEKNPVETLDDIRTMEYILRGKSWKFDSARYAECESIVGDRGVPMLWVPRFNLQRIIIEMMGFENTLYAMMDNLADMERLINTINETDQCMLETVAASPVPILNFGDNLDQHFISPKLFERYALPAYESRTKCFRNAGKYTHSHWDGSVKQLLPYARKTGLDGIEALTPLPQGDITIEEIKEALGDMILLDGIPMTSFLPNEPIAELEEMTHRIIETFQPNLILGISDELSPVCDIERVRRVSEIVNAHKC